MKTKLIIIIIFCSVMSSFGQTRPPIVTNEIQTQNFEWENNLIDRDLMVYYRMIGDSCFQISPLQEVPVWSERFCFEQKQYVYWAEGDLWLCDGCTVIYNENSVLIRRDPECGNCWQYSNDGGTTWIDLWCESRLDRILKVVPSSLNILKLGNYIEWTGEDSLRAGIEYIGFKRDSTNEGNWLHFVNDSVKWDALPEDSLYFENLGNWAKAKDTVDLFWLPSDSVGRIYYGTQGEWLKNEYGKINVYSDDEPAGNFASTNSSGLWAYSKNLTAFSAHADNGIAISASGGINGGGIFTETSHNPALKSYSYDSTAVDAHSTYGYAVMARSDFGYSGHFYGGKGVKIENNLYVTDSLTTDDAIVNKTLRVKDVATFQDSISAWGNLKVFGKTTSGTLQMGTGSTISRSGTMMSYDLWFGTQAEWNANTPKNGIYPQAETTFWTIKD